jgi:uncharacterized protein (TIGR00645 family)
MKLIKNIIVNILFGSKWLLTFFYFGLIIGMVCYAYVYVKEIIHLLSDVQSLSKEIVMITVLELVDMVMIANLVKMIITGSYNSSVDKTHGFSNENVSSGILKVKMSTSLIGVTSIHMLQSFINANQVSWEVLNKQLIIHGVFIVGAIGLAYVEYLHDKGDALNPHDTDGVRPLPKENDKR